LFRMREIFGNQCAQLHIIKRRIGFKTKRLRMECCLEQVPREARVAKAVAARDGREILVQLRETTLRQYVIVLLRTSHQNLDELVSCVIRKRDGPRKARAESGVAVDEPTHELGVPGDNDDQPCAVVFHSL
jgi:hypothetical protein